MEGKIMSENNDFKEILKKIEKLEEGQRKLEKRFKKLQKDIINIQEDIYIDDDEDDSDDEYDDEYDDVMIYDDECEFEITCPYCGFEFIADDNSKGKEQVKCPKCHKTIELDWDMCDGSCENCGNCDHHEKLNVAEDEDSYSNNEKQDNKDKPEQNNEDDM